ncbi:MAG: DUF502 domain-containing protein [Cytophagaceae bacterium]|nr:DUF502 domain-containing protein [Cytophagaceae bacterium]MBK9510324.1 DUF502 domain-containing protein [Cytophagaceae bacterium]MBK9933103.1 DUF502 domain-containing protein [Cytophagaceae bacterium]MBL0303179.1 DUF502 domain-containing protein [Cytophagaceae bacterium]MBL0326027.1 DUF502 domain-containing protein [Cytophagaceae bacterium]
MFGKLLNKFISYFIRGLLFVAPVGFTALILYSAFDFVDSLVRIRFSIDRPDELFFIPGLGFFIVVAGTALIGFVFTRLLPQTIQNWIENGIKNLPLVKIFYSAFKDLVSAFVGDKKKFKTGVLITLNVNSNIKKLGFLTQDNLDILNLPDMVSVYCPHSYAFSGEMFIVPKEQVEILSISSAEVMKIIVSGGVSISDN